MLTVLLTNDPKRNSFCSLEEATDYISGYIIGGEDFLKLNSNLQRKYLSNAYFDIINLPYSIDLGLFSKQPENIQDLFKKAQCEQAYSMFRPASEAIYLRNEGIQESVAGSEKIVTIPGEKYSLSKRARNYIENLIDFSLSVY